MPSRPAWPGESGEHPVSCNWNRVVLWWAGPAAALALAYAARHGWVQAEGLGVWCEQHSRAWPCPWREAVIQAFIHHRLSTVALACAALSWALALRPTPARTGAGIQELAIGSAWLGLCVAVCGLVLYDTDRSALAALLCALSSLRLLQSTDDPTDDPADDSMAAEGHRL